MTKDRFQGGLPPAGARKRRPRLIEDAVLHARACRREALSEAWARVWKNAGAAGGDGVSVDSFQRGSWQRLGELERDLVEGSYRPGPLRRVMVPKPSGGERPLDIPCVRDRIAQTALAMALSPLLDEEFEEASFGYRPGRSVQQAVRRVGYLRTLGLTHVVDADISRYFESVPHELLMARLGESMTDGPATALIAHWLEHWGPDGRGLAQGSPLSPLLANLFLDRLDESFAGENARIVRFADDFVILCRSEKGAEAALSLAESLLARHGLTLNRDKTRVTGFEAGFRFLGHAFVNSFILADPDNTFSGGAEAELRLVAQRDAEAEARAAEEAERDAVLKRARLDPGQRVLYLTRGGRRLSVRQAAFVVEEAALGHDTNGAARGDDWRDILLLHQGDVDRIEAAPHAEVTPEAIQHALANDVEIAFVNGFGQTLGWVTKGHDPRAGRQLAQARAALDPARKLELARAFVDGRVRNQRALLRRLNRDRADGTVIAALARLNQLIRRLPHCPDIDVLRGLEGRAAADYWPSFGRLLREPFGLRRRERENAREPADIMLNMTASLLARDVAVAAVRAGLHCGFGFLHESGDNREALVWDLMEEFRGPLAEAAVSAAINQRVVEPMMFAPRPGETGARLLAPARDGLIRTYQRFAEREVKDPVTGRRRSWRALMSDQAIRLAQAIESGEPYRPVIIDY